jgi:hypothetical protein
MYVSIHAVDADTDDGPFSSKGKRTRVEPSGVEFHTFGTDLSIRAEVSETFGTGRRGGSAKTVNRRLIIELNKHDLARILEEAIKSHLVTSTFAFSRLAVGIQAAAASCARSEFLDDSGN